VYASHQSKDVRVGNQRHINTGKIRQTSSTLMSYRERKHMTAKRVWDKRYEMMMWTGVDFSKNKSNKPNNDGALSGTMTWNLVFRAAAFRKFTTVSEQPNVITISLLENVNKKHVKQPSFE
jgi:hypothetical protein